MATSGSNSYSTDGGRLKLILSWSRIQTDITNNRSKIKLTLQLAHSGTGVWFSAKKSGVLHGQSFTYSGGFSGTGTKTLRTRELWVNHNADGTKSITFNASFNIAITYRGKRLSSMSTSVKADIDRIPRASSINSFSIANHLKPSTENTVNLSLTRATSSFTHDIELRDGSTVIQKWTGKGTPKTLSLSSSSVDTLLNRMRSVTSRKLTLRVQTKSGSSVIGTTTRNATTYVDSSVKPSVSELTTSSSTGEEFDWQYVQSHSKLTGSYSSSAKGGATIQSESITVKRNDDVMVINGTSGTTSRPFKYDGIYEVVASTTDSRGRTSTDTTEINVLRYFVPKINVFDVSRRVNAPTIVEYEFNVDFAKYARGDSATITIERQSNGLAWEQVYENYTEWASHDFTGTFSDNSVDTSYSFRITVKDLVGSVVSSTVTVSTQRVVLDIHKNEGVGIGKIHERGVLDVDGTAFFNGDIALTPKPTATGRVAKALHIKQPKGTGSEIHFEREGEGTTARLGHFYSDNRNFGFLNPVGVVSFNAKDFWFFGSDLKISANGSPMTSVIGSGSNANGEWVKFYDGTLICHYREFQIDYESGSRLSGRWNFPSSFLPDSSVSVIATRRSFHGAAYQTHSAISASSENKSTRALVRAFLPSSGSYSSGNYIRTNLIAIGRWK